MSWDPLDSVNSVTVWFPFLSFQAFFLVCFYRKEANTYPGSNLTLQDDWD